MERQNRSDLQRILEAAASQGDALDGCDADAELGLTLPGDGNETTFSEEGGYQTLLCEGRAVGGFGPGELCEEGIKNGYQALLPELRAFVPKPARVKEIIDEDAPSYAVLVDGVRHGLSLANARRARAHIGFIDGRGLIESSR